MARKKSTKDPASHLTPRLVAERLLVGVDTVLTWIHTERLKAANISMTDARPRWRINKEDLDAFLEARSNRSGDAKTKEPTAQVKRRPRRSVKRYV